MSGPSEPDDDLPILYVAGPMTGLPEFNYPAFMAAEARLCELGYRVLNPARNDCPSGSEWGVWMRAGLAQVLQAEGVALLPGWRSSRGAKLERKTARALGVPCRALTAWIKDVRSTGGDQ